MKVERMTKIDNESKTKAFATLDTGELLIGGIRVVEGKKGFFVSMPQSKGKDDRWYESVHPKNDETREAISAIVLEAFSK